MTIVINGTTGISGVDGSAGTPAVQGTDTNTGVFYPAADTVGVSTGGSERVRVDSSGNFGVGTSTFNSVRTVIQGSQTGGAPQTSGTAQTYGLLRLQGTTFTSVLDFGTNGGNYNWIQATDNSNLATNYSLAINPNGGNVGIGTSSPGAKLEVKGASATAGQLSIHDGTGDTTVSGVTAASLLFQARDTSVRTIAEIDAVNTTTNGTGGAMVFQTRISDTLAERMRIDSSGNLQFNSGYGSVATAYGCRAWVNFNGTGVVAIRASGNVTSITDNGTGDYTVNFTTAMPDANYCFTAVGGLKAETFGMPLQSNAANSRVAGSLRFCTASPADTNQDATWVNATFFR